MILSKTYAITGFLWIHKNVTRQVLFMHNFWLNEGEMTQCTGAMQEVEAECRRETWQVCFLCSIFYIEGGEPVL